MKNLRRTPGELEEIVRMAVPSLFDGEKVEIAARAGAEQNNDGGGATEYTSATLSLCILELISAGPVSENWLIRSFTEKESCTLGWEQIGEQIWQLVDDELIQVVEPVQKSISFSLTAAGQEVLSGR